MTYCRPSDEFVGETYQKARTIGIPETVQVGYGTEKDHSKSGKYRTISQ